MLHLLRDCPRAKTVWFAFHVPMRMQGTVKLNNDKIYFIFICWYIRKWRNKGVLDIQFHFPFNPLEIIQGYATE